MRAMYGARVSMAWRRDESDGAGGGGTLGAMALERGRGGGSNTSSKTCFGTNQEGTLGGGYHLGRTAVEATVKPAMKDGRGPLGKVAARGRESRTQSKVLTGVEHRHMAWKGTEGHGA